jgi:hypothetical protein
LRSGACFLEEARPAESDLASLGAGADQRAAVIDEQPACPQRRQRRINDLDADVTRATPDLLHGLSVARITRLA